MTNFKLPVPFITLWTIILFLKNTFLGNGYPLSHILLIMDQTQRSIGNSYRQRPNNPLNSSLRVVLPFNPHHAKELKKTLAQYDIETTFTSAPTLKIMLCNTSSRPDEELLLAYIKSPAHIILTFTLVKHTGPSPYTLKNMKQPIASTTSMIAPQGI